MRGLGFICRDIRPQGPFEGELVEADFFFSRKRETLNEEDKKVLLLWETVEKINLFQGWL